MTKEKKHRYCVIYTQTAKQKKLAGVLKEALPEERGTVFYPCMECYRRDCGKLVIQPIFPGYVFIRSDMNALELHEFIRRNRTKMGIYVRELGFGSGRYDAGKAAGNAPVVSNSAGEAGKEGYAADRDYELNDLNEEESRFMDFLLGIVSCESKDTGSGENFDDFVEFEEYEEDAFSQEKGFSDGLLRMSYGYKEDGKYVVMEGPLKVYENRIANVNRHERRAYLDFSVNGYAVRAGFEVKPKSFWFPEDN